jgi:predicted metalloprotease with PDZ domain
LTHLLRVLPVCFLLCRLAAAECGPLPKAAPFVSYAIEPKIESGALTLDVLLTFRLSGRSATLILPSQWQGQNELYRAISKLEVLSPGTSLTNGEQLWTRHLSFPSGQVVRIAYHVAKDWTGKIDASSYFRVMLDPSYFQVAGPNFLVYPSVPDDEDLPILLEWKNLLPGWKVVDSFYGDAPCQYAKTKIIKLANGLFAGGDLRVREFQVEGKEVFVATRGQWSFPDEAFEALVQKVLSAERLFWSDVTIPKYLITLLPSDDDPGNYGGTALEDSFALFTGSETKLDFQTKFLLAHEMFHSWNAAKLGEIRSETPFWFTEGFTDYYARFLLKRAHLITAEEYDSDVRTAYTEYRTSRVLHASGAQVRQQFYADDDIRRLAYLRGDLLALRWNRMIERKSSGQQSLDSAMLDLSRKAKSQELVLTTSFLASHFAKYVGSEAISDVQRYVENGETIPPVESETAVESSAH